jgi:hypothetical protein
MSKISCTGNSRDKEWKGNDKEITERLPETRPSGENKVDVAALIHPTTHPTCTVKIS